MTLSLNCKDGDPVCTHTVYGKTEEVLQNAKKHGIERSGSQRNAYSSLNECLMFR